MKKFVLILFVVSLLVSCRTYNDANQIWMPKKHGPKDYSKPPKRR